jgi:signal transduction histidine kinase
MASAAYDAHQALDHLSTGVLIFNPANKLVYDNETARRILGANLVYVRSDGWTALATLIDSHAEEGSKANDLRHKAQRQAGQALRFGMLIGRAYVPCWLTNFPNDKGQMMTQITIDDPDWTPLTELMNTFRAEARAAINDTSGQAVFIRKLMKNPPASLSAVQLGERSMGMINLISTKMHRLQLLVDLLHRLEVIRTGQLNAQIEEGRRKIEIEDFIEDFLEELNENPLVDPGESTAEVHQRLQTDIEENLQVMAPKSYLRNILRDVLRNAFMYSEAPSPVKLKIFSASQGRHVQFDIVDQGCGIRTKESDRVFEPFLRARQPQVMREHGYGLSLYLAKAELEAMNGRIWHESEEGNGATFSFKLPSS